MAVGIGASRRHTDKGTTIALRELPKADVSDVSPGESRAGKPNVPDDTTKSDVRPNVRTAPDVSLSDASDVRGPSDVRPNVSPDSAYLSPSDGTDNTDDRSGDSSETPVSYDLEPGESATVGELRARRRSSGSLPAEEVANEMRKARSGPGLALKAYLQKPGEQRLEYVTRAVLIALGREGEDWRGHAAQVRALTEDPNNHPLGCPCEECA